MNSRKQFLAKNGSSHPPVGCQAAGTPTIQGLAEVSNCPTVAEPQHGGSPNQDSPLGIFGRGK